MVLASAIEPLRAARDLSGKRLFSWQLASLDGGPATSSSKISIAVDLPLARVGATDALVLVSGYGMRNLMDRESAQTLRRRVRGLPVVAGLDTGSWLLAQIGLLTGRQATIHWMERDSLAEAFPEVTVVSGPYIRDGSYITCAGATGVLSWSLDLIGAKGGDALRFDVANMFDREHREDDGQTTPDLPDRMTSYSLPDALRRAIRAMRETAEQPVPLSEIAERAALSLRSMDRLFDRHLGLSSGKYYRQIRLSHARALATETSLSLAEIASRSGFASPATLARAYRARFGETVRQSSRK
ncbi:GlxA family transcriptional regulator [Defluviimonas sp. SAOS-178_SWC]|uniref:GlxA family transcriptional regulator n=1 Tax=Defluviimonas sp. SAOS-178_SWC TaxID=3121287 RepID=UPI0032219968